MPKELYQLDEECCGCSACAAICPQNAIKMSENEEGFLYPHIDKEKCIDCGMCIDICEFKKFDQNDFASEENHRLVYAARSVDEEVLQKSSSGGGVYSTFGLYIKYGRCGCSLFI